MSNFLFFPRQYLQEITWNITSPPSNSANITSTGLEIISTTFNTFLNYGSGMPRLFNGAEAGNQGASSSGSGSGQTWVFPTNADNTAFWSQYILHYQFNGGAWETSADPVAGVEQLKFIWNVSGSVFSTYGTDWVIGDVIKMRISPTQQ